MADKRKPDRRSRRQFLLLGLLAGAAKAAGQTAGPQEKPATGDTVKMLTPEGQLVEVDRAVIDQLAKRQKTSNKDILDWCRPPKST